MSTEPVTLPENGSFIDIPPPTNTSSRNTSEASAVETPQTPPPIGGVYLWEVGKGWQIPILSFPIMDSKNVVSDRVVCVAKSDTHPDIAADLIAEYLTDTVLRIDSDALVDIEVSLKQDLILVTGQVMCSHPAKSAIIHSDQFLGTLNGSLRDVLRDIGFTSSAKPTTGTGPATPPQNGSSSPKRQTSLNASTLSTGTVPASPPIVSDQSDETDEEYIDPSQVHIIIAISQGTAETIGSKGTVKCRASFSDIEFDCQSVARTIENSLHQYRLSTPGAISSSGGILVEVHGVDDKIVLIDVSVNAKINSDRFISEMGTVVLTSEFLRSLSPRINDETVVIIRNANRSRDTGRSSQMCGKDWRNPLRYGHVLARQEAVGLVQSGKCTKCLIDITFSQSALRVSELPILSIGLLDVTGPKAGHTELIEIVKDRCFKKTVNEIRDSVMRDQVTSFFAISAGGSSCSHESINLI